MNSTTLPTVVTFGDQSLSIIDREGTPWLAAADLARALGYKDASAIARLHARNVKEFTQTMTGTVNLTVPNQNRPVLVRIFSPRGCHLIAMFARTPKAAAFRRWVLDVLEGLAVPRPIAPPKPAVDSERLRVRYDFPFPNAPAERDHKSAERSLALLKASVHLYVDDLRARAHMNEYAEHIGQCLTRGFTEMQEAGVLIHVAGTYLARWKGVKS